MLAGEHRAYKANTSLRPTNVPLGPAQGHLRATEDPLGPTQSPLGLTLGPPRPTEPALGPKEDPLRLTEDSQTRPAQIDGGPLKPTNGALSHLKSNMTPSVFIYSFFFIRVFITNGQVSL